MENVQADKEDLTHYSVSKAGVIALTRALAKEHGKQGFRVNAIVPGGIITRGTKAVAKRFFQLQFGLLNSIPVFNRPNGSSQEVLSTAIWSIEDGDRIQAAVAHRADGSAG